MFSARTPADLTPNRLAEALRAARSAGRPILDLTESNPTRAGFDYPAGLLAPLADPRGLTYAPAPLGLPDARAAVSADYARRGVTVPAERIVLTASTSDAYACLFKLLGDAGDEILVPRPSYPLFDHLTQLDLVAARPYDLDPAGAWSIDFDSLQRALTPRTRAILVVSPNNPTGSFVKPDEVARLAGIAAAHGLALVADEVFADYELARGARAASGGLAERDDVLTFSLGGLSKSVGLPQVKLAWLAVGGPASLAGVALERLEFICDTYLAVSTSVQLAAGALLERGADVRAQIAARVAANYGRLAAVAASMPACRALESEGGWYGVLQIPSIGTEEALVVDLLDRDGVLAHPGYFFDFPRESFLIVSLLTPEAVFAEGIDRVLRHVDCPVAARE